MSHLTRRCTGPLWHATRAERAALAIYAGAAPASRGRMEGVSRLTEATGSDDGGGGYGIVS